MDSVILPLPRKASNDMGYFVSSVLKGHAKLMLSYLSVVFLSFLSSLPPFLFILERSCVLFRSFALGSSASSFVTSLFFSLVSFLIITLRARP